MMTLRYFGLVGGTGSQQTSPYSYTFELELEYCSRSHDAAADSLKHARGSFVVFVSKNSWQKLNHA